MNFNYKTLSKSCSRLCRVKVFGMTREAVSRPETTSIGNRNAKKTIDDYTAGRSSAVLASRKLHIAAAARGYLFNVPAIYKSLFQYFHSVSVVSPSFSTSLWTILLLSGLLKLTFCFKTGLNTTSTCSRYS